MANNAGVTRLGLALLLKFFELEERFLRDWGELPAAALAFVAEQVGVPAGDLAGYDWAGRSIKHYRAQIREAFAHPTHPRPTVALQLLAAWSPESCARA